MSSRELGRTVRHAASAIMIALLAATSLEAAPSAPPRPSGWRYIPTRPAAPKGAPNVLLVLTDDVGFGASSTFGGAIPTPNLDRLAANGLRYNEFHTTAMCSPTRAALLTGRNHHAVSSGAISNVALDEEGYTSVIPQSAATVGRVLRDNGYDTAWFGKNHNTPEWEVGPMGPFERWPNGFGFDYFYGFNAAMTDQFNPILTENRNTVRRDPADASYTLDRDLADHLIHWLGVQHTLQPERPFFAYLAPGSMHSPQQAPADWIAKFHGKFDQGWDVMREQVFASQKQMGIIPANAGLASRPPGLAAWSSLTAEQQHIYTRMMEVAAAQLAHLDFQVGRVLDQLKATGQLDNTMVVFIQGDNGASLEKEIGSTNENLGFAGINETDADLKAKMDVAGSELTAGQYHAAWAFATNTPFPWGKQIASHLGGLRDGMVISWPARIKDVGTIRRQFSHVIDIVPTIYEVAKVTPPKTVDGVAQQPLDGASMVYTFDNPAAPSRHTEQYFEMLGNRSYYKEGWIASTTPSIGPWAFNRADPNKLPWELYNLNEDYSQTRNIAAQYPAKLAELQADFDKAARKNNIYPLSADLLGRMDANLRPRALPATGVHRFQPGDTPYPSYAWPGLKPKWTAAAKLSVASDRADGPVFVSGSRFTSYGLALVAGVPVFTYDPTGRSQERQVLRAAGPLALGAHDVTVGFAPEEGGVRLSLTVDGKVTDQAYVSKIIRAGGVSYVGRPAIDDRTGPRQCGCTIEELAISTD